MKASKDFAKEMLGFVIVSLLFSSVLSAPTGSPALECNVPKFNSSARFGFDYGAVDDQGGMAFLYKSNKVEIRNDTDRLKIPQSIVENWVDMLEADWEDGKIFYHCENIDPFLRIKTFKYNYKMFVGSKVGNKCYVRADIGGDNFIIPRKLFCASDVSKNNFYTTV